MTTPAPNRRNNKMIKVGLCTAIVAAFAVIMFAPIVPISYEEVIGDLGNPDDGPLGRMVSKNVSLFQIVTGIE